jgi:hypothetical protein
VCGGIEGLGSMGWMAVGCARGKGLGRAVTHAGKVYVANLYYSQELHAAAAAQHSAPGPVRGGLLGVLSMSGPPRSPRCGDKAGLDLVQHDAKNALHLYQTRAS